MLLSILIPVYNERTVVERSLALVLAAPLPENMERELVIVDDCSTDGTSDILERLAAAEPRIRLFRHAVNQGKGAAVRTAIENAHGRFLPGAGRRPGIRSLGVRQAAAAAARRPRRRGVRIALPGGRTIARAAVLAFHDQQGADAGLEHVQQPERDRHGDVLQGFPHGSAEEHSRSAPTVSASSRRSP